MIRLWKSKKTKEEKEENDVKKLEPKMTKNHILGNVVLEIPEGTSETLMKECFKTFVDVCEFKETMVRYKITTIYGIDLIQAELPKFLLIEKMLQYHKDVFGMVQSGCKKAVIYSISYGEEILGVLGIEQDQEIYKVMSKEGSC
jgi:hypothetical protein